jgi:hypothetical protein
LEGKSFQTIDSVMQQLANNVNQEMRFRCISLTDTSLSSTTEHHHIVNGVDIILVGPFVVVDKEERRPLIVSSCKIALFFFFRQCSSTVHNDIGSTTRPFEKRMTKWLASVSFYFIDSCCQSCPLPFCLCCRLTVKLLSFMTSTTTTRLWQT